MRAVTTAGQALLKSDAGALLAVVLLLEAAFRLLVIDRRFEYDAEGSSALYGILARNYLRFGWAETHGLPVLTVGRAPGAPLVFYHDHPPLVPLLIAPFYAAFGVGEWQARLPIAIITLATIATIYMLVARFATTRAGVIAAALFAAAPMTLYFGGFPDVIGMPLLLMVLVAVGGYFRFHAAPASASLLRFVLSFIPAAVCDWPAYLIVPVFLGHFVATRPFRQWGWIIGFCAAATMMFAAIYVYIAVAADVSWAWMVPLLARRSGVTGATHITFVEWLRAAWGFNRAFHSVPLLGVAALWIALYGWRLRSHDPGAPLARLLLAWGIVYVVVGTKAVVDHEWVWCLLTPGLAVSGALMIDHGIGAAERRGFAESAARAAACAIVIWAAWSGYASFTRLYPPVPARTYSPIDAGRAIQSAAPEANDVALYLDAEESEAQLWFYGDRPLRTRVWTMTDVERRIADDTVDLVYDFRVQPWRARATGLVIPLRPYDVAMFRAEMARRYPQVELPEDLAANFAVFRLAPSSPVSHARR